MSYGDYVTTLDISKLGQCLISGIIEDTYNPESIYSNPPLIYDNNKPFAIKKSNGAGKSALISVIQWVLFNRTMHSPNPGDAVINYFTGKDCWAKIEFKNGDSITRTRNLSGHSELIYIRDGDQYTTTSTTLSTAKAQQIQLAKQFSLDWELFCGSVFFNQYSKPWMEMADQSRKKAFERLLRVDRLAYYAKVSKDKAEKLESEVERLHTKKDNITESIERLKRELTRLTNAVGSFEANKQERYDAAMLAIEAKKEKLAAIELPDLEKLESLWDRVAQIKTKIAEVRAKADATRSIISSLAGTAESHEQLIKRWRAKSGKICVSCEQPVDSTHTASKTQPIEEQLALCNEQIAGHKESLKKDTDLLERIEAGLEAKKPKVTLREARETHERHASLEKEIKRLERDAANILKETNPHDVSTEDVENKIKKYEEELAKLETDIFKADYLNRHYTYVHKAYNDRTKIKSNIVRERIPYINERIKHYLEIFQLDITLELTDSLGINSNMWGYDFQSGGERKRTDVAMMLATFDFHEYMYGRQSNLLVLDEVDGRMDDDGIDALVNVIKDDLAHRVETILIISHKPMMHDMFPNEIIVRRTNRESRLEILHEQ